MYLKDTFFKAFLLSIRLKSRIEMLKALAIGVLFQHIRWRATAAKRTCMRFYFNIRIGDRSIQSVGVGVPFACCTYKISAQLWELVS